MHLVHVFLQVTFFKAFSPTFATLMLLCGEMISTEVQDCFKQIIWVGWGGEINNFHISCREVHK